MDKKQYMKLYNQKQKEKNLKIWNNPEVNPWDNNTEKYCSCCKTNLARNNFTLSKVENDGLQRWCNDCRHKRFHENYILNMLRQAKKRAREKNIEFDLTSEDIQIPFLCPVLNIPLFHGPNIKQHKGSPSLDRIDNNKGYIKGNIQIISWRANDLKRNGTIEEFESIIQYIKRNQYKQE